jgi:IAA-amino acid hydrolase
LNDEQTGTDAEAATVALLMKQLIPAAERFADDLVSLRRDLHRHPELSFRENRTAGVMADRAEALGYSVRRGVGRTGVVAELKNGAGPVVALRADMDALPIQEQNDVPYRSTVAGAMHACGHDAHMAMLLGGARLLADAKTQSELPAGTIRLLFQPSEEASDDENRSGAARMIEDGALDGVNAVFGLHIGGHLEAGRIFLAQPGPIMAGAVTFRGTVLGRSAHAARPQEGVDAIVLAAHVILACQNAVSRRLAPREEGVLSIGIVSGGVAENILAERVHVQGTIRYFDKDVRERLIAELRRAFAVADALGGGHELDIRYGYPPVVNEKTMTALVRDTTVGLFGADAFGVLDPWMGAEDFSLMLERAPGCFFWLGGALEQPREHHHPNFDIDERVLPRGSALLAGIAINALQQ